jgi:hypothetical protein
MQLVQPGVADIDITDSYPKLRKRQHHTLHRHIASTAEATKLFPGFIRSQICSSKTTPVPANMAQHPSTHHNCLLH